MENSTENIRLTIIYPGTGSGKITKIYDLRSDKTTVNSIRKVIQASASVDGFADRMDEIELKISNGITIKYKSIQTKRGLSKKIISLEELFRRGGKIFE